MDHRGRVVGMPGLPRRACCVVVMRQQEYDGTMRVWRQEQPERRGGARGSRGAPASRGHCLPFQTTVARRFASGRPGRRGRHLGGSRGAAAWSLGLWGTHPSVAENGPSRTCWTPFRCPGGRVWGEGGGWRVYGGQGVGLWRVGGLKRAACRGTLASTSIELVSLKTVHRRAPNHPPACARF